MDMENGKDVHNTVIDRKSITRKNSKIFFLNGDLHKIVKTNASANVCHAYNYAKKEVVKYTYSDYKKFKKTAYRISDVAKMMRRHEDRIRRAIWNLEVTRPAIIEYETKIGTYYFSEENIYEIRDYFANVHRGRPRGDGIVVSKNVPTVAELDAILGKKPMIYIKTEEGKYVPVWSAEDFG